MHCRYSLPSPIVQTKALQGPLRPGQLPHLLLTLRANAGTGRLRLEREGVERDLYLCDGAIAAAESSAPTDSLEWLLFSAGVLSEDRHGDVRSLIDAGVRRGRALVETGGLSPAVLCEWTERRVRFLARDVLSWKSGTFDFDGSGEPPPGAILVHLDPVDILLEASRDGGSGSSRSASQPPSEAILSSAPVRAGFARTLLAHESYVLSLLDGRRRVSEVCFLSEIGEAETLAVLSLLVMAGCATDAGERRSVRVAPGEVDRSVTVPQLDALLAEPLPTPEGESTAELRAAVRIYNEVFSLVCGHLVKEVGPIAEQLLEKSLRDTRERHAAIFQRAWPGRDGTLPEDALIRSLNLLKEPNRRAILVAGLHDHLIAMTGCVRRTLGASHEVLVLRRIAESGFARIGGDR